MSALTVAERYGYGKCYGSADPKHYTHRDTYAHAWDQQYGDRHAGIGWHGDGYVNGVDRHRDSYCCRIRIGYTYCLRYQFQ